MDLIRKLSIITLGCALLAAGDDPVMKVRGERAQAQGIAEGDLPPVPRGILEPPPLPPPETHLKDTPGGAKAARARRHSSSLRAGKSKKSAKAAKTSKHPAKAGRNTKKRAKH